MDFEGITARLDGLCPGATTAKTSEPTKDPFVEIEPTRLVEVAESLRDDTELAFDLLLAVTGADYPEITPKAKKGEEPVPIPGRFEVVYHLLSTVHNHRLVVKMRLPHSDRPIAPSVCSVWPAADWHERETWDLVGIDFDTHPDLRRILCPDDWVGHALRKDYVFPKEYRGISCE